MKKSIALILCLMLALVSVFALASCNEQDPPAESKAESNADTTPAADTAADTTPVAEETEAPDTDADESEAPDTTPADETSADETGAGDSTVETLPDGTEYDPEECVLIYTAEDLMTFNANVQANNEGEGVDYSYMTVYFMNDIDMTGYEWIPLDGYWLEEVIFDGLGHTISNLQFAEFNPEPYGATTDFGSGFIGVNQWPNTFKNITFENAAVVAKRSHVGCIIGTNRCNGDVIFENVHVDGFAGEGTLPGIGTTIRVAGFIGANATGFPVFTDCSAKNLELYGFHNLAGFVGYDMTGSVSETSFTNCVVENCKFTFSYCQSESYTVDMPKKYVSVFYNASNWADNIDYVVDRGNSFKEVFYYDWTNDDEEYRAEVFRSWTREEAAADAQA